MAKPEWGTKRTGPCGTKFYDFNKSPIICPNCGGEVFVSQSKTKAAKSESKIFHEDVSQKENISGKNIEIPDVLDSDIIDDNIVDEEVTLNNEEHAEIQNTIPSDEDINLIQGDDDIDLNVEIDEDDNKL